MQAKYIALLASLPSGLKKKARLTKNVYSSEIYNVFKRIKSRCQHGCDTRRIMVKLLAQICSPAETTYMNIS